MKKLLLASTLVLLSIAVFSQSPAATLKETNPSAAGFSAERLSRIDKMLQEYVDRKWTAGGSAIIVHNGSIVYYKGFGYDDIDAKKPEKKDAIFRIASQTKAITSVAIMMLYEQGKFLLDDPISNYIPEFKNPKVLDKFNEKDTTYTTVPAKREITIRDLLTHTSGIGYAQIGSKEANAIYYKNGIWGGIGVDKIILADKMKKLGSMPLFHQPGEKWTYGLNTDLLGYLVEVVSGMSLADFFKKNIFEPLGMNDTYFYLPKEKYNRLAALYAEDSTKHVKKMDEYIDLNGKVYRDFPIMAGTYYSGGGGLSSTAYDYAIFMQMLLNGGEYNGKRILSRTSIRMMTQNQVGDLGEFGLGFGIVTEKSAAKTPVSVGTFDWGGMFSSSYWIDPKEKIVAQLFLNQFPNSHGEIHNKFKALVYQALQ